MWRNDLRYAAAAVGLVLACPSCTQYGVVDALMARAYRPDRTTGIDVAPYVLLAGDTHCHVSPPDNPGHVGRDLAATDVLAREEHLDFVILTPHLRGDFYADPVLRAESVAALDMLRSEVRALSSGPLYIVGFEHTTHGGHTTLAFADLAEVLASAPVDEAAADPGLFFERWVDAGGLLFVNHPLLVPYDESSMIDSARWDLSWAPWTKTSGWRADVTAIHRLAIGWEAENLGVTHLRDGWLVGREGVSRREVLAMMDRRILSERRRMTPVGGTDSHSHHLRATMFVLARERSERGVREALVAGRTCVASPFACTLEARAAEPTAEWRRVGDTVPHDGTVETRVAGEDVALSLDGRVVARPGTGETAVISAPPGRCAILRAHASGGDSAAIHLGLCALGTRLPGPG